MMTGPVRHPPVPVSLLSDCRAWWSQCSTAVCPCLSGRAVWSWRSAYLPSVEPGEESETGGGLTQGDSVGPRTLHWLDGTCEQCESHDDTQHHTRISDIVAPGRGQTRGRELPGGNPSGFIASRAQVGGRQVCRAGLPPGQHRQPVWRRTQGGSEEGRTSTWSSLQTPGQTPAPPAAAVLSAQTCGRGSPLHL